MKKRKRNILRSWQTNIDKRGLLHPAGISDTCGGCMFQDIPYENQLLLKKEYLNTLFEGKITVEKIYPSTPFGYRNRMDMVTAFGKFGLREAGSYKFVVDIESCHIMQEKTNTVFKKIRPLVKNLEGYNYLNHQGYLRYVIFRQARFTGQTMVNFVIAARENRLEGLLSGLGDEADSISLIFNDGLADLSFGEIMENTRKGHIEESFDGIRYLITPNSFFQSNSEIALEMYREIKKAVKGRVLDLYSGVGSISLFVAEAAESVTGVEMVGEAVDIARQNKELNGVTNADFVTADAKDFIREQGAACTTLILDPPRSGMHPKMLKYITEAAPETIIYMSCNPAALKDELEAFGNYTLESFQAFDMFPQTAHLEALAIFKKK